MGAQSEVLQHRVLYRGAWKKENVVQNYEAAIFMVLSELVTERSRNTYNTVMTNVSK